MPSGIYIRTEKAKEAMRLGQKKRIHKQDCFCCICKNKRGEYIGENHPCKGKKHSLESNIRSGATNRGKTKENCEHILRAINTRKKRYDSGELIHSFLNKHHTEKTKQKLSSFFKGKTYEELYGVEKANEMHNKKRGKKQSIEFIEKRISKIRGKKQIKEHIEKRMKSRFETIQKRGYYISKETREKMRKAQSNRPRRLHSKETREKMSLDRMGDKNPCWKGGPKFCIECGKKLASRKATRCVRCSANNNEHKEKVIKNTLKAISLRPNKFEMRALNYLNIIYNNKFKYTGDGSFIVNNRSADAYAKELNTIALFNGIYWHLEKRGYEINEKNKRIVEKFESQPFVSSGYKVIFIWEDELNQLNRQLESRIIGNTRDSESRNSKFEA